MDTRRFGAKTLIFTHNLDNLLCPPMKNRLRSPDALIGRGGFSLVELLTVIAVIAVLAAILIPVISSVRERSMVSTNVSNLRQINQAAGLWSVENQGGVVPSYDPGDALGDSLNHWTGLLAPYMGWQNDRIPFKSFFSTPNAMPVYINPFHPSRWGYGHNVNAFHFIKRDSNSAIYNETLVQSDTVENPAQTVFFVTSCSGNGNETFDRGWRGYVRPPGGYDDYIVDYSGPGNEAVVLWFDGHITTETEDYLGNAELWDIN